MTKTNTVCADTRSEISVLEQAMVLLMKAEVRGKALAGWVILGQVGYA